MRVWCAPGGVTPIHEISVVDMLKVRQAMQSFGVAVRPDRVVTVWPCCASVACARAWECKCSCGAEAKTSTAANTTTRTPASQRRPRNIGETITQELRVHAHSTASVDRPLPQKNSSFANPWSGCQRRDVPTGAVASALLGERDIVQFDEPTASWTSLEKGSSMRSSNATWNGNGDHGICHSPIVAAACSSLRKSWRKVVTSLQWMSTVAGSVLRTDRASDCDSGFASTHRHIRSTH